MKSLMVSRGIQARWLAGLLALPLGLAACGDKLATGHAIEPSVAQMDVVSGNGQSAAAGTELPAPVVVRVLDGSGRPVANQIVNFKVTQGGGSVFGGAAVTNAQGVAQERWTLGAVGPQALEARAVDSSTGSKQVFAAFQATATDPASTVATVTVSPATVALTTGQTRQLTAAATSANGQPITGRTFTWQSGNTSVATVSSSGVVTAVGAGSTTITATTGGRSGSATITVGAATTTAPARVTDLRVTSVTANSVTLQWTQVSNGAGGAAHYAIRRGSPTLNWSAGYPTEVTVSGTGVGQTATYTFTGLPAGTASQFQLVSYRGTLNQDAVFGQLSNTVTGTTSAAPAPVATVAVSPTSATLNVGQTQSLTATARDANGQPLSGRPITWQTSNASVATVNSSGLVTAVAAGTATITASSEGRSGTASITVSGGSTGGGGSLGQTIFYEGFESGNLNQWQDGVNPNLQRIVTTGAYAGSRALEMTIPAGSEGSSLTRFFMPGYDSVFVRLHVRFSSGWTGGSGTYLAKLSGSRTDNQWSSIGVAGRCPSGSDFFALNQLVLPNSPGRLRFYNYWPEMQRESNGTTCWGNESGSGVRYHTHPNLDDGRWHRIDFWVKLNSPGQTNSVQRMWVDGVLAAEWPGLRIRTTSDLRLNVLTIHAYAGSQSNVRRLYYDEIFVTTRSPY